jgi:hypothetical protein
MPIRLWIILMFDNVGSKSLSVDSVHQSSLRGIITLWSLFCARMVDSFLYSRRIFAYNEQRSLDYRQVIA